MTDGGGGDEPFRILVVCTANICRSPLAERLLQRGAASRCLALEVSSAGFLYDDEPAAERMVAVAAERGLDLSDHRSRIVRAEMLDAADLVVTMERRHARELIVEHDAVAGQVFTLGGVVEVLADCDAAGEMSAVDRVSGLVDARSPTDLLGGGPDEVADPHGRSRRAHRLVADRLGLLVDALLDGLYGADR